MTPSLGGYSFTPLARNYNAITTDPGAQDFAAAVSGTAERIFYIHVDHLNTPRLIADQVGQAVWRWDQQEPFGVNAPDENPSGLGAFEFPLRFPGQYFDKETNLHWNYFRDYDPVLGRYVESDPIGIAGGINTFAYANGNPMMYSDESGLTSCNGTWRRYKWERLIIDVSMVQRHSTQIVRQGRQMPPLSCVCYWLCEDCDGRPSFLHLGGSDFRQRLAL